jgi:hypothetical protein
MNYRSHLVYRRIGAAFSPQCRRYRIGCFPFDGTD